MIFSKKFAMVDIETHRRQSELWAKNSPNRHTRFEAQKIPQELKDHI